MKARTSIQRFLLILVLFFLWSPFVSGTEHSGLIYAVLFTVVLVAASLAVEDRRSTKIWTVLGAAPGISFFWLNHLLPDRVPIRYAHFFAWIFVTWVSLRFFRYVLRARHVDREVLSAAVATYLMAALGWSNAYVLVADANPQAFAFAAGSPPGQSLLGFPALYFSLITLATVGYGDIVPVSPVARLLAMTEAVGGMFYMTMLVARLVSVYSSDKKSVTGAE